MPDLVEELADLAAHVRARRPLIHYLPNWVTANDVANAMLAFGASPIMAVASDEVADIPSDALAINLGTPSPERMIAAEVAGRAAAERNIPIVLDPVGVGATPWRMTHAHRLVSAVPMTILRCNTGEAAALLGYRGEAHGVDAVDTRRDPGALARSLARRFSCVAAVTGPVDIISDGDRNLSIANGTPMLGAITGTGCMVTGLVAACAALPSDPLLAAGAALLAFGVAGEVAARAATGPGSLRVALLDALYTLDETTYLRYGKARWI